MNTPFELLWGVDVAIKKLRPGANFSLNNSTFVFWEDPTGHPPPAWTEVQEQLEKDKQAYNEYHGIVEIEPATVIHSEEESLPEETPISKVRIEICNSCELYMPKIRVCSECHCFMPLKTRLSSVSCPVGKW
jgi:hypothetical protein